MSQATPPPVNISSRAASQVASLIAAQKNPALKLRLSVKGGGCSGFQYHFDFDEKTQDGDIVVSRDGVTMLVDSLSLLYIMGAEVDYVEDLVGAAFSGC